MGNLPLINPPNSAQPTNSLLDLCGSPLTFFLSGQTTPNANVFQINPPSDSRHLYLVAAGFNVTAFTSGGITMNVVFTDTNGNPQTLQPIIAGGAGLAIGNPLIIPCKANSLITITTTGVFVATYDMFGFVLRLS